MKKYLVIGKPIDHSLSPQLHNHWIKKYNIEAIYEKKEINDVEIKTLIEKTVLKQNPNLRKIFNSEIKSWPLYSTPNIHPSTNKKILLRKFIIPLYITCSVMAGQLDHSETI